eukprot:4128704-Pyramimonas_sp.AAC.1
MVDFDYNSGKTPQDGVTTQRRITRGSSQTPARPQIRSVMLPRPSTSTTARRWVQGRTQSRH